MNYNVKHCMFIIVTTFVITSHYWKKLMM